MGCLFLSGVPLDHEEGSLLGGASSGESSISKNPPAKSMTNSVLKACAAATVMTTPVLAELFIYEPFGYMPTTEANDGRFFGDSSQPYDTGLGLGAWSHRDAGGNGTPNGTAPNNEGDIADEGVSFIDDAGNELPVAGNAYERRLRVGQVAASAPIDPAATTGLTADNSTMWMSFLFQDFGFSGPDFGIGLHSEKMVSDDNQGLESPGHGVGFGIVATGGQSRNIRTAVYENSTAASRLAAESTPTFNGPAGSDVFLLALKVNWNPEGTPDEIYAFIINDITTEPEEDDAMVMDTFDFDLATQQSLDVLNFSDTQVGYVDEIRVGTSFDAVMGRVAEKSSPQLSVGVSGGNLQISWNSNPGSYYVLWSSASLDADLSQWESVNVPGSVEVDGVFQIPHSAPRNQHVIARPADTARFYRFEELPLPPRTVFMDDFEDGGAGWNAGFDSVDVEQNTLWGRGAPLVGPPSAFSGSACFGTNLDSNYGVNSASWLRSPVIDLTGDARATLSFQQWVEIDPFDDLDGGSVRVLDATSLEELAVLTPPSINGLDLLEWQVQSFEFPENAVGREVVIEFLFISDGDNVLDSPGWFIDDVMVTAPSS